MEYMLLIYPYGQALALVTNAIERRHLERRRREIAS